MSRARRWAVRHHHMLRVGPLHAWCQKVRARHTAESARTTSTAGIQRSFIQALQSTTHDSPALYDRSHRPETALKFVALFVALLSNVLVHAVRTRRKFESHARPFGVFVGFVARAIFQTKQFQSARPQ